MFTNFYSAFYIYKYRYINECTKFTDIENAINEFKRGKLKTPCFQISFPTTEMKLLSWISDVST